MAIKNEATTEWAIAGITSAGMFVGYNVFALMNRKTGKGYTLHIPSGGASIGLSASAGDPSWVYFRTREPVTADAFDGVNCRITSANIGVFYGYSITYLTIRKSWWGWSDVRAYIKMTGTGIMLPGGGVSGGGTILTDGSPCSLRYARLYLDIDLDFEEPLPRMTRVQYKPQESKKNLIVDSDAAFGFDSDQLNSQGRKALEECAFYLNMREKEPVMINGFTDSIGEEAYNLNLSKRRAETVRRWFQGKGVLGADQFRTEGWGEEEPVAPNTINGQDNPAGRAKNRRVEIVFR
ncbi:MAG: OmpA family protein [Pseudomonadota bacterium]